jgi:putative flippase GtrA
MPSDTSFLSRHREFALFVVCGGGAAAINVGSRIVFSRFLPFAVAVTLAYILGIITAFILNRALVFREPAKSLGQQAFWFVLINLAGLVQTLAVSLVLERWGLRWVGWTWQPELVAHMVGVAVPILSSYVGHKYVTFATH